MQLYKLLLSLFILNTSAHLLSQPPVPIATENNSKQTTKENDTKKKLVTVILCNGSIIEYYENK